MPWGSYCNPTQRRKGQCAVIAEIQEGCKKQLERSPVEET